MLRQITMFQASLAGRTSRSDIGQQGKSANGQAQNSNREQPVFQPNLSFDVVLFFSHGVDPFNSLGTHPAGAVDQPSLTTNTHRPYGSIGYGGAAGQRW